MGVPCTTILVAGTNDRSPDTHQVEPALVQFLEPLRLDSAPSWQNIFGDPLRGQYSRTSEHTLQEAQLSGLSACLVSAMPGWELLTVGDTESKQLSALTTK